VENDCNEIDDIRPIDREVPHLACRIELVPHRHERGIVCVEDLDEPRKISERLRQPDLVDDDDVDPAGPDVGDQALQHTGRSILPPENPPSAYAQRIARNGRMLRLAGPS
jgi:hypothetical protein